MNWSLRSAAGTAAEIRRQYPDLQAADRHSAIRAGDITRDLAAQVLSIESQSA
jgi:hypothetical protein